MSVIGGGFHQNVKLDAQLEWNYMLSQIVDRKGINKDFFYDVGKCLIMWYNNYVPLDKGDLMAYVQAHPSKNNVTITYQVSYAQAQYTGKDKGDPTGRIPNLEGWNRKKAGTTSYWDKYAWTVHSNQIMADIEEIREAHAHDD